jgi:hypothetical protein
MRVAAECSNGQSGGPIIAVDGSLAGIVSGGDGGETVGPTGLRIGIAIDAVLAAGRATPEDEPPPIPEEQEPPPPPIADPCAELRILIQQNAEAITALAAVAKIPGEKGDQGLKGDKGDKGDPGTDGESPVIDLDELVAAVIERLPPTRFQARAPDGTAVGPVVERRLGEIVYLKSNKPE